jgi:hypothetical protein
LTESLKKASFTLAFLFRLFISMAWFRFPLPTRLTVFIPVVPAQAAPRRTLG